MALGAKSPVAWQCDVCWYYEPLDIKRGECRRYPPRPKGDGHHDVPVVAPNFWCGEFKLDPDFAEGAA
jgi:hypothetical protein